MSDSIIFLIPPALSLSFNVSSPYSYLCTNDECLFRLILGSLSYSYAPYSRMDAFDDNLPIWNLNSVDYGVKM
jgi:hypothetical protein